MSAMSDVVERIERPSQDDFQRNYVDRGKPVVITGAMEHWNALSSWNTEYLKSVVGHTKVLVSVSPNGIFKPNAEDGFDERFYDDMQFKDFLDLITSAELPRPKEYYLQQQSIPLTFPSLKGDIVLPDYVDRRRCIQENIWIGSNGNTSPLHYDCMLDNLLAQVLGRKRIVLFDPGQLPLLYPYPAASKIPHLSQVDIDNPDLQKFPKFMRSSSISCNIEPGEMLFIPSNWWHQVYSFGMTISVNLWWRASLSNAFTRPVMRLLLRKASVLDVCRFSARHVSAWFIGHGRN